jgi:hypothetical protein
MNQRAHLSHSENLRIAATRGVDRSSTVGHPGDLATGALTSVGHATDPNCRICALETSRPEDTYVSGDPIVIVSKGRGSIALFNRELDHVQVVPSTHVSRISALPAEEMAHLLAALRRVALAQQQDGATFNLRTIEMLGSHGHICIRVARAPSSEHPGSLSDNPSMVARLRSALETVQ